jgi:hypothetical protein
MSDPLSFIWPHCDSAEPLFSEHALTPWSRGAFGDLVAAGFLCPANNSDSVVCPSCGDHVEEVLLTDGPDGLSEFSIYCPASLRVKVQPLLLRQWTIDFDVLTQAVAASLSLGGLCTALAPGRLWRLGRTKWQGASRDVLFARGLNWPDGRALASQIAHTTRPIVFVADRFPAADIWPGRVPSVIAMSQVATSRGGQIEIDHDAVLAVILEVDSDRAADSSATIDAGQLKVMIRQQVKAEERSQLTDDILVAAYRQEGSVRKAATFLSKQTGQLVTKDKVQSAVARAGGADAVARDGDSGSVVRTVASQRRDRSKKILRKPELVEDQ